MSYEPITERINISREAFRILKCDESCFDVIRDNKNPDRICDTLTNTIIKNMDKRDLPKINETGTSYNKNKDTQKFSFKLQKAANDRLDKSGVSYKGEYVSRILEIYAKKAYYERERIFYKECIEKAEAARDGGKLLELRYRGTTKRVYPFDIRVDEWSSYNYLIGTEITDDGRKIIDLRIAYISDYELANSEANARSPFPRAEIERKISECGVQFISEEPVTIKVKLTEPGKDMYNHMVFMRPVITSADASDIYTFKCSEKQARYYFFKFGKEAEIIEPEKLRNEFRADYEAAAELYKSDKS